MGRKRGVQHEFAKRALQRKRTLLNGDSSVIKDDDVPTAKPENAAPATFTFNIGWFAHREEDRYAKVVLPLPTRKTTEPLVAYRGWRLVEDERGPALMSVTANVVWDGPILRAEGPPSEIPPFGRSGTHGIYAYPDAARLLNESQLVWGEIEVFGRVVIHETGLRAESARIRRILVRRPTALRYDQWFTGAAWLTAFGVKAEESRKEIAPSDDVLKKLAERYQCDVRWWGTPFTD
jgi:hypothetical protein